MEGDSYGTVGFAAGDPRATPFTDGEKLIAELITHMLERELGHYQYEAAFDETGDGMTVTDDEARILHVNEAAARLYGENESALIGRSMREFLPDDFDFEAEWGDIRSGTVTRDELAIVSSDGGVNPVEFTAKPNVVPGQHLIVSRSVADRSEYDRPGSDPKADGDERNQQLEDFASVVSHDLRNPLNVATGRLEVAMEECDNEHLPPIQDAHDRMSGLIDDLLVLAAQGQAVTDCKPVRVADVARDSWNNVETGQSTIEIDVEREVTADTSRLKQVFENLFRNAVEHSDDPVVVTVGEGETGFYVADNGSGIPEESRETVFEPGYSTSDTGTGFGLRIVDEIVEAHGWAIEISESANGGTKFDITAADRSDP